MKVKVSYEKREFECDIKHGAKVIDVLSDIGANPETVLVSKNGTIVPETETIGLRDKIEVFRVVSGG